MVVRAEDWTRQHISRRESVSGFFLVPERPKKNPRMPQAWVSQSMENLPKQSAFDEDSSFPNVKNPHGVPKSEILWALRSEALSFLGLG